MWWWGWGAERGREAASPAKGKGGSAHRLMTPVARPPRSVQPRLCTRRLIALFLRVLAHPRSTQRRTARTITLEGVRAHIGRAVIVTSAHTCNQGDVYYYIYHVRLSSQVSSIETTISIAIERYFQRGRGTDRDRCNNGTSFSSVSLITSIRFRRRRQLLRRRRAFVSAVAARSNEFDCHSVASTFCSVISKPARRKARLGRRSDS